MLRGRTCERVMAGLVLISLIATRSASETEDSIRQQLSELRRGGPFAEMAAGELALSARAAYEGGRLARAGEIVAGLGALLRDVDPRLRVAVIDALSGAGDAARDAFPALRGALEDADPEVRVAAAQALARLDASPEAILPTLIEGLARSPHRAIGALGQLGPAGHPALGALLDLAPRASKAGTTESLIAAVSKIDPGSVRELERRIDGGRREHAAELVTQLQARPDTGAERGLEALGAVGVESLIEVLRQRPPPVPRVTYGVLPQGPAAPGQGMVAMSPMSFMAQLPRVRAAQALGRIGSAAAAAVPVLVETLEDGSEPAEVKILAAESLGKIAADPPRAVPALTSALSASEQAFGPFGPTSLRGAAAEALGLYGHHAVSTADALRRARRLETAPAMIRLIDQALDRVGRPSPEQLEAAAAAREKTTVAGMKQFRDPVSGIGFDYPERYLVQESRAPDGELIFMLVREQAGGPLDWVFDLSIDEVHASQAFDSLSAFALHQGKLHCSADGPEGSVHCPAVARHTPFQTRSGRAGLEMYLVEEDTRGDKTTHRQKGPIFAVDISTGGRRILLLSPTSMAEADPRHLESLRQISESVQLAKQTSSQ